MATTSYNKHTEGSRVGNWVEETALKEMTGVSRYESWTKEDETGRVPIITKAVGVDKFTDTKSRVIYHTDNVESKECMSTTRDLHNPAKYAAVHTGRPGMGPRAAAMTRMLAEEAATKTAESGPKPEWTTAARDAFVRHSDKEYTGPKGRRVMKTMNGEDLPPGCRDAEFLRAAHLSTMKPTLTAEEMEAIAPTTALEAAMPVTIYTQRRAESIFRGTAAPSTNPFARNSGFTNPITDSTKQHALAIDDISKKPPGIKPAATMAIGAELSLRVAIGRLKARLAVKRGVDGVRSLRDVLARYDASGDGQLSPEEFAAALRHLRVDASPADVAELVAYFDTDKSGRMSVPELQLALCAPLSESRLALVNAAFARADRSGDGAITADELARLQNFAEHPDVLLGIKTAAAARGDFLRAFDSIPDGRVTKEEFVGYYTDVGSVVDDDTVFEGMVRGVWGLGGGAVAGAGGGGAGGAGAGAEVLRVQVTHNDASQEVVEVSYAGVTREDLPLIRALLRRAGVKGVHSIKVL